MTPEKIQNLPDWEKELANMALERSRDLRHRLESIQSMEALEVLAAETEAFYKKLNREWLSKRLETCPTCKIEPDAEQSEESPQPKHEEALTVAEKRQKFLEEIRSSLKHG